MHVSSIIFILEIEFYLLQHHERTAHRSSRKGSTLARNDPSTDSKPMRASMKVLAPVSWSELPITENLIGLCLSSFSEQLVILA